MFLVATLLILATIALDIHFYRVDTAREGRSDLLITILLLVFAFRAGWVGRRMLMPSAEAVLAHDKRPPIVYLRPFDEDARRIDPLPIGRRIGGRPVASQFAGLASHEGQIAHALQQIGPFIAVGAPGDALAPVGAARLYLADDEWQSKVEELVRGAAAIVLLPEISEGTVWEVTKVARWVDPRRVLVIVPNPALRPLGYARIQALTAKTLAVPLPAQCANADAFIFDAAAQPQPIVFGRNARSALLPFVEQIRALTTAQPAPS